MIRHAYGFDQVGLTGAGQTIAIIDAYDDPTIGDDLSVFSQKYGLPQADFQKVLPASGTPAFDDTWSYETALDVEWSHAIAPGARILLVEAASGSTRDLMTAVDTAVGMGAMQVSMSWGTFEFPADLMTDARFSHPGVTFVASTGDYGAGAQGNASSPYVVSVGGTTLSTDAKGNRLSETAWSNSGGGFSAYQARPAFQKGFNQSHQRATPDVSYNAGSSTGYSIYSSQASKGWCVVCGTSAGAPQWAALFALANQGRATDGKPSLGTGYRFGTNSVLYAIAGGTHYANAGNDFIDISVGSNGLPAGPGYDLVTGLGSPVANRLIPDLIAS